MTDKEAVELLQTFLGVLKEVADRLMVEAETVAELDRIQDALTGKNGIYTLLQKEIGRLIKEDRMKNV